MVQIISNLKPSVDTTDLLKHYKYLVLMRVVNFHFLAEIFPLTTPAVSLNLDEQVSEFPWFSFHRH